jgi:DNA-binding beta-propeller fold protein YncE
MIDTEITTGRGPHAVAIDPVKGLLFVGHFTDSYIGVVSIDRRFPRTYGKTLATIGKPVPPRTSK